MTVWPDQPTEAGAQPQTRRQARANERSQAARRAGTAEPTPAGEIPEMTTQRGPASPSEPTPPDSAQSDATAHESSELESTGGEPGRPAIPATAFGFDGLFGDRSGDKEKASLFREAPDPSRPEPVTQPMTIVRPAPSPAPASAASAPSAPTSPQAQPDVSAGAPVPERTLTRRELRAMLQAQEANKQANTGAPTGEAVFPVTFTDRPETEAEEAKAAQVGTGAPATPAAASASVGIDSTDSSTSAEPSTSEKTAWPFAPLSPSASQRTAEPSIDTSVTQSPASPFASFGTAAAPSAPAAQEPAASPQAATPAPASSAAPASADETASQERRPFTPPTGHWSTAAELEDGNEPITSRNVGHSTAATTTNALILPSLPQPDATGPLTSTGEILVTGSIDLPRALGSTGAHPDRIDSSDLDRLLDGEENEFNTSEVAPVRASRAISTHTSTRGVIAPPKKRGNTLPVVLMITAGVLAVGVIGLLVAAYVLKVF